MSAITACLTGEDKGQLKAELQNLRRKGALKVSADWGNTGPDPDRSCGRCRAELGRVINRGAYCRSCRLKVCKGCREYNFRATDWVCTVCYKRMEIQAASGEWMNEFVRRPSRRRDARVYVPAADIIKKTIRRSWTISNPTPRWAALRNSAELRPYNSLPRGQDINNYPSLALHQDVRNSKTTFEALKRSPARRAKSEDVYAERKFEPSSINAYALGDSGAKDKQCEQADPSQSPKRPARVNPLMSISLRESKETRERRRSPRRKTETDLETEGNDNKSDKVKKEEISTETAKDQDLPKPTDIKDKPSERHVSFDSTKASDLAYFRSRSLSNSKSSKEVKTMPFSTRSLPEEGYGKDEKGEENSENAVVELCDIEPLSGTVFRKMTVRRRRQQNMRKVAAMDAGDYPRFFMYLPLNKRIKPLQEKGWRRPPENDLFDILLPDGDDYRLVFVNSDSSSKEEDIDDNDSSSASSFPLDECDWDYFEPGVARPQQVLGWGSPFGSPRVYRKRLIDSPLGSPLLQRRPRIRESSDEDISAPSTSESLSNPLTPPQSIAGVTDAIQCVHQSTTGQPVDQTPHPLTCKTCGGCAPTPAAQYIPVPVPIPIPFPVPWGANLIGALPNNLVPINKFPNLQRSSANTQASDFWQYIAQVQGFPWSIFEKPMIDERVAEKKVDKKDGDGDGDDGGKSANQAEEDLDDEPRGHLECENRGSSASDSTPVDSSDEDAEHPLVRRVYNVTGPPNDRESDDALPSSNVTTDNEDDIEHKSSADEKEREDEEESSSGSADTDSNDTGTVADQKPKRFSRVFVVNHKGSNLSSSGSIASSSGDTDSSDNDTDTELDCTVVLTNIKHLNSEYDESIVTESPADEERDESDYFTGKASFLSIRYIGEENNDGYYEKSEKAANSAIASTSSGNSQCSEIAKETCGRQNKARTRRYNAKTKKRQDTENVKAKNVLNENDEDIGCDKVLPTKTDPVKKVFDEKKAVKVPRTDCSEALCTKDFKNNKSDSFNNSESSHVDTNEKSKILENEITKFIDAEVNHSSRMLLSKLESTSSKAEQVNCDKTNSSYDNIEQEKLHLIIENIREETEKSLRKTDLKNIESNDITVFPTINLSDNLTSESQDNKIHEIYDITGNDQPNNSEKDDLTAYTLKDKELVTGHVLLKEVVKAENDTHTKLDLLSILQSGDDLKETEDKNNVPKSRTSNNENKIVEGALSNETEEGVGLVLNTDLPNVIKSLTTNESNLSDSVDPIKSTHKTGINEVKSIYDAYIDDFSNKYKSDYVYSSSPGLSDVSAESLSSSDAEKESSRSRKKWNATTSATKTDSHSNVKGVTKKKTKFIESDDDDNASHESTVKKETDSASNACGDRTGVLQSVIGEQPQVNSRYGASAKYTSLVMITNDASYQQVNIVTSDTTRVVPGEEQVVVVSHTYKQDEASMDNENDHENPNHLHAERNVTVITSAETLSAFEEGLADDDSWVENLSYEDEDEGNDDDFPTNSISENSSSGDEVTLTCSAVVDQEDELRGYHRAAIDFTLHTIVEESCEESEVELAPRKSKKERPASATDLEKYFFFGLGDGTIPSINSNREDAYSETSSIYSEGMESLGGTEDNQNENPEELASSRLEKYFLSGFMGFTAERRDSDGSVGSDSEGKPSPEQRRKRLVRARGTGRSHSNSLDNLLGNPDLAGSEQQLEAQNNSEDSSSSDSDTYDEVLGFEKPDGQFDTVKRKKTKKQKASLEDIKNLETTQEEQEGREYNDDDDRNKTPQPENLPSNLSTNKNQQSRDSGFVGSCDDLLKDQRDINKSPDITLHQENKSESILEGKREDKTFTESFPPATNLTRKDSFNNWSSDEETNLMMTKMRQFFKTMVANSSASKPTTPNLSNRSSPKPFPRAKNRCKPPQLVYFENELTRLMKTVPGIRDDQVREIVEYLSSEDTWSDSYDSSDYTSSDLEGACMKSALQQQISDSCKQIINKFDNNAEDEEGDAGDGGIIDDSHGLNKETAFVYQKLVASFEKMATEDKPASTSGPNSPPLIAKVMHHIGNRLVALMHEVSSGESHASNSPKGRNYHRRLQQKLSNASTTTTDEDSTSDTNLPDTFVEGSLSSFNLLPRSRSHDLLMGETNKNLHQSISGVSEISEEREASDCERFSWRGSFESALLATDSRNKLSLIGGEGSASASALAIAAKRRSAGDLLFSHKSLSREQLDRVRSCGSIGGGTSEDKLWVATATKPNRRRSSVPDATSCGSGASADGEDEDEEMENRATLPRSMQSGPQTTNSLPRLPTTSVATLQKAQSHHFLSQNVKSARYRPPGITRLMPTQPKRAVSAPGLQPSHQRRGRRSQQSNVPSDDVSLSEAHSSPMLASRTGSKSATPSPVAPGSRRKTASVSSEGWPTHDEDLDRLVSMHHTRSSLSSLGLRSDSMASVYSGAGEGRYGYVTVRGQVEFGLQYNYKAGALEIKIKQCKDLAPVDIKRNRSDPYVKVYLLPDKSKSGKRKTKVKKHTLNPVFDECLKFHMSLNELEIRTLWLSVWHSDMFGRNDFLGEVMMALENKVFDDPTPKWYNLQERTEPFDDMLSFKGDIIVCLKFVPPDMTVHKKGKRSRGSLHILVKEAKALTAVKANGSSDPFCKSYLLPDKGRSAKQKTPVVRRTINPVWNYTFVYDDVTLQELAERSLELTVWDHDRLASNEFLGMVRFSLGTGKHYGKPVEWMDSTGKELNLWKSMLERPNFWVEGCLPLRPTVGSRVT